MKLFLLLLTLVFAEENSTIGFLTDEPVDLFKKCPITEIPIDFGCNNCTSINLVVYKYENCREETYERYNYIDTVKDKQPLQLQVPLSDYKIKHSPQTLKIHKSESDLTITFWFARKECLYLVGEVFCGEDDFASHARSVNFLILNQQPPIYTVRTNKLKDNPLRFVSEQIIIGTCHISPSDSTSAIRTTVEKRLKINKPNGFFTDPDYSDVKYILEKNCNKE